VSLVAIPATERLDFLAELARRLPGDGQGLRVAFE
jgi:hypothetical protein